MDKNTKEKRSIISRILGKFKLSNAGMKTSYPSLVETTSTNKEISYPSLYLNIKQCPDLSGYDVGDSVTMVLEGEIISHSADKNMKSERETFDIKIKKIGCECEDDEEGEEE